MTEVAHPGQQHRRTSGIGGGDDLRVALRAAGLDERGDAGRGAHLERVGERDRRRPRRRRRPWPAPRRPSRRRAGHCRRGSSARPRRRRPRSVAHEHDRVRLDVPAHAPREVESRRAPRPWVSAAWRPSRLAGSSAATSASVTQHGAAGAAQLQAGLRRRAEPGSSSTRRFGLRARIVERVGQRRRRGTRPRGRCSSAARRARASTAPRDARRRRRRRSPGRPPARAPRRRAESSASAAPHGLACLTITHAAPRRSRARPVAAAASRMLL